AIETAADLGKAKTPRRAVDEPRAEPTLQILNLLGHRRLGDLQLPRRGREASGHDHLGEDRHARHPIHVRLTGDLSGSRTNHMPDRGMTAGGQPQQLRVMTKNRSAIERWPPVTRRMSMTITVNPVVVGGGQAGLAVSHYLIKRSVDHVVLEQADRPGEEW